MARLTDIADAIAAELHAAPEETFAAPFAAGRRCVPLVDLADLAGLHVTVVPAARSMATATRGSASDEIAADIAVQQRVNPASIDDEVAGLLGLIEQIADYLRGRPLAAAPGAAWISTVHEPPYEPDHLLDHNLFTGVLRVTYRQLV